MKINIFLASLILMLAISAFSELHCYTKDFNQTTKDKTLREAKGIFDYQENLISNIEFATTNYGIWALDFSKIQGKVVWPRTSQNQYIFAGGFWFGAKKEVNGELKKLVAVSYNPYSGLSWFVPGRYEDGSELDEENYKKYRSYFSTDFKENGTPLIESDGDNWPLWMTDYYPKFEFGINSNDYIHDSALRKFDNYPMGPLFQSDEHIFATYKDTELKYYEGGASVREQEGYPLGLQVEENIYSWKDGELKDAMVITYKIKNVSDDVLWQCWFAPVIDFDIIANNIGYEGARNDRASHYYHDEELNLVYAWSNIDKGEEGEGFGYLGVSMLESPALDNQLFIRKDKAFFNPDEQIGLKTFNNWNIYDNVQESTDRYYFMSSQRLDGDDGPGDKKILMATGPFNMNPGDEARFAIAITFAMPAKGGEADGTYEDVANTNAEQISLVELQELVKEKYYQVFTSIVNEQIPTNSVISPNPASEYIEINPPLIPPFSKGDAEGRGISEIKIYNTFGEMLMSTSVNFVDTSASGGQKRIDISHLPVGIYFLSFQNEFLKFIVVR